MHRVSIVEQRDSAPPTIDDDAVEDSVEAGRKRRIFFAQVDEVCRLIRANRVAALLQTLIHVASGKLLARENEDRVAYFVLLRAGIAEGALARCPSDIDAKIL